MNKQSTNRDELIELYFLQSLSDEQNAELVESLESDKTARDRFRRAAQIDAELRHRSDRSTAPIEVRPKLASSGRRPILKLAAIAASILLITSIAWFVLQQPNRPFIATTAALSVVSGDVHIVGRDGVRRPGSVGDSIRSQDTLQVSGEDSYAGVTFSDQTSVTLVRQSAATFSYDAGKQVTVHSGKLVANVSPQPAGHPMVMTTSQVRVDVLGTRFAVAADESTTDLAVQSGQVRVTRASGSESVIVENGERTQTKVSEQMVVSEAPPSPNTWLMDFEAGVPSGWLGDPVTDELPQGSQGAVKPVFRPEYSSQTVQAPENWTLGLFTVEATTHVHVTFKMSRPDWLNVFSQVRSSNFETSNLMLCNSAPFMRAKPDTWYTMTLPIQKWRRKQKQTTEFSDGQPPVAGEVIYGLSISSVGKERGLVVDRIWVTTDGPGKFVMELVE